MAKPLMTALALALNLAAFAPTQTYAADPAECRTLGRDLGVIIKAATGDDDLTQAVAAATEAHCIVVDELPIVLKTEGQGTVPATGPTKPAVSAWETVCRRRYHTFDVATGTVIRAHTHTRVRCPVKP